MNAEAFSDATRYCKDISLGNYPVKNEVAQRTVYNKYREECNNNNKCGDDGYKRSDKPKIESYILDVNESSRYVSYLSCMKDKG